MAPYPAAVKACWKRAHDDSAALACSLEPAKITERYWVPASFPWRMPWVGSWSSQKTLRRASSLAGNSIGWRELNHIAIRLIPWAPRCQTVCAEDRRRTLSGSPRRRLVHRDDLAVVPLGRCGQQILVLLRHLVGLRVVRVRPVARLVLEPDRQPDLVGVGLAAVDGCEQEALCLPLFLSPHY